MALPPAAAAARARLALGVLLGLLLGQLAPLRWGPTSGNHAPAAGPTPGGHRAAFVGSPLRTVLKAHTNQLPRTVAHFFATDTIEGRTRTSPLPVVEQPAYTLNDGNLMPKIGFGTYRIPAGQETYDAVTDALEADYRMIDTAQVYGNEASVGRAVKDSGLPRESVFVATKIWDDSHGFDEALEAGRTSVQQLGLGYADLILMHSPGLRMVETYDALLRLRDTGETRAIGVANFGIRHLEALRRAGRPPPAVNQIEMHPVIYPERKKLVRYCQRHGILVQAYGSLLCGQEAALAHPALASVAASSGRSATQVLLQWGLSRDFQVIPKSVTPSRIKENFNVFDSTLGAADVNKLEDDMRSIGSLGVYWNPVDDAPLDTGEVRKLVAGYFDDMPSWGPEEPEDLLEAPVQRDYAAAAGGQADPLMRPWIPPPASAPLVSGRTMPPPANLTWTRQMWARLNSPEGSATRLPCGPKNRCSPSEADARSPVHVDDNFISRAHADALLQLPSVKSGWYETVTAACSAQGDGGQVTKRSTNWLPPGDELVEDLAQRAAKTFGLPRDHVEIMRLGRYRGPGDIFEPHVDWFFGGEKNVLEQGQRIATALVYLTDVPRAAGGTTWFPHWDLDITPAKGRASFWSNVDEKGLARQDMEHASMPLIKPDALKDIVVIFARDRPVPQEDPTETGAADDYARKQARQAEIPTPPASALELFLLFGFAVSIGLIYFVLSLSF